MTGNREEFVTGRRLGLQVARELNAKIRKPTTLGLEYSTVVYERIRQIHPSRWFQLAREKLLNKKEKKKKN